MISLQLYFQNSNSSNLVEISAKMVLICQYENRITFILKRVNKQFYYQDFMRFDKKSKYQGPNRQSGNKKEVSMNKRGSSYKYSFQNSTSISKTRLPQVKLPANTNNECIKQRRKQSNLFAHDKIKFDRIQPLIRRSYQSRKNICLSSQQHNLRKQNYLNTKYNLRRNKLISITYQNRHIYERINSQKSLYSSKDFDKSFQSNCSLSRRLSLSKLSKISSRKSFEVVKLSPKVQPNPKPMNEIKFDTKNNISNAQTDKVYRYMSIFCNRLNLKKSSTQKEQQQEQYNSKMIKCNKQNKATPTTKIETINTGFSQRLKRKINCVILNHL